MSEVIEKIKKRNGNVVEFDSPKITAAIAKAGQATGEFEQREARKIDRGPQFEDGWIILIDLSHSSFPHPH